MILKDDKGTVVDYFWNFPYDIKNIGLSLSGGMDSALILWCLVEMLRGRQHLAKDTKIWCTHGYDITRTKTHSYEAAQRVLDWVKWHQKDNTFIQPLHVFGYEKKENLSKEVLHNANYEYIQRRYKVPFIIRGVTQGWDKDRPLGKSGDKNEAELKEISKSTWILPFGAVNKKFIAYQYKRHALEGLRAITVSCTADTLEPCQKCYWCDERYWAFGDYDGGHKRRIVL